MKFKKTIIVVVSTAVVTMGAFFFGEKLFANKIPIAIGAEQKSEVSKPPVSTDNLETVKTKENFKKIFAKIISESNARYDYEIDQYADEAVPDIAMNESGKYTGSGSAEFSGTNIQVQGVDEADVVKTDGRYIYHLGYNSLSIVDAKDPKNLVLVKTINLSEYSPDLYLSPNEMFLNNKTLTVICNSYGNFDPKGAEANSETSADYVYPLYDATRIIVYDISNPENPSEIRNYAIEAGYVSSRKINDIIYLVTNNYIYDENPSVPRVYDSKTKEVKEISLDKTYIIPDAEDTNLTNITAINLTNPDSEMLVESFVGPSSTIYSSIKNLYLTSTKYDYKNEDYKITSNIFRFSIDGQNVTFKAKTSIDGFINNQFSMDEHENYLRVATTTNFNAESSNTFYVLDEFLSTVGKISDIAKGESIKSVRFAGEKAYVVTYEQTDPLFVIDAKEPTNPKILGELKIPGYSTYLHPYDENHLIGLGVDTEFDEKNEFVKEKGMKLSMFDVTDINNPKEMFTEVIGDQGTYSDALYNHKSFMFSKDKELLVLPIYISREETKQFDGVTYYGSFYFNGAVVYNVNLNGFKQKALISHNESAYDYDTINRSLYIDNTVFTVSNSVIKSFDLKTNKVIGHLKIQEY